MDKLNTIKTCSNNPKEKKKRKIELKDREIKQKTNNKISPKSK